MQTSSKKLNPKVKKQVLDQLSTLLSDLRSPDEATAWMNDFMTDTERLVFAKRLAVAQMLWEQKSYQEIKDRLKVSSATISSVSDTIDKKGLRLAQDKIKLEGWAETLLSNPFSLLKI